MSCLLDARETNCSLTCSPSCLMRSRMKYITLCFCSPLSAWAKPKTGFGPLPGQSQSFWCTRERPDNVVRPRVCTCVTAEIQDTSRISFAARTQNTFGWLCLLFCRFYRLWLNRTVLCRQIHSEIIAHSQQCLTGEGRPSLVPEDLFPASDSCTKKEVKAHRMNEWMNEINQLLLFVAYVRILSLGLHT